MQFLHELGLVLLPGLVLAHAPVAAAALQQPIGLEQLLGDQAHLAGIGRLHGVEGLPHGAGDAARPAGARARFHHLWRHHLRSHRLARSTGGHQGPASGPALGALLPQLRRLLRSEGLDPLGLGRGRTTLEATDAAAGGAALGGLLEAFQALLAGGGLALGPAVLVGGDAAAAAGVARLALAAQGVDASHQAVEPIGRIEQVHGQVIHGRRRFLPKPQALELLLHGLHHLLAQLPGHLVAVLPGDDPGRGLIQRRLDRAGEVLELVEGAQHGAGLAGLLLALLDVDRVAALLLEELHRLGALGDGPQQAGLTAQGLLQAVGQLRPGQAGVHRLLAGSEQVDLLLRLPAADRQVLHVLLEGFVRHGRPGLQDLVDLPLLVVIQAGGADHRRPAHAQVALNHVVKHLVGQLGQGQSFLRLAAVERQPFGLHFLECLDAGVAEELGGIGLGAGTLSDVLPGADCPSLLGVLGIQIADGHFLGAKPLRQRQAVVAVHHIGLPVGRVLPDRHHPGQVRIPALHT